MQVAPQVEGPGGTRKKLPAEQLMQEPEPEVEQSLQDAAQNLQICVPESGYVCVGHVVLHSAGPTRLCKYFVVRQLVQEVDPTALHPSQVTSHPKHLCEVESG